MTISEILNSALVSMQDYRRWQYRLPGTIVHKCNPHGCEIIGTVGNVQFNQAVQLQEILDEYPRCYHVLRVSSLYYRPW
jgi:hypothetical protein